MNTNLLLVLMLALQLTHTLGQLLQRRSEVFHLLPQGVDLLRGRHKHKVVMSLLDLTTCILLVSVAELIFKPMTKLWLNHLVSVTIMRF